MGHGTVSYSHLVPDASVLVALDVMRGRCVGRLHMLRIWFQHQLGTTCGCSSRRPRRLHSLPRSWCTLAVFCTPFRCQFHCVFVASSRLGTASTLRATFACQVRARRWFISRVRIRLLPRGSSRRKGGSWGKGMPMSTLIGGEIPHVDSGTLL